MTKLIREQPTQPKQGVRKMRKEVKVVHSDEVEMVTAYQSTVGGYKVKRLVTKKRVGSDRLMVGVLEIDPNRKGYRWSYSEEEGNDEVYYVASGKVRLYYDDKYVDAEEGDAIYMPAGWKFRLDNMGSKRVLLVYALTPPIE